MEKEIIQLCMAPLISLGFSLIFQIRKELRLWTCIGGLINWGSYLLFSHLMGGLFVPCLLFSFCCALYAEIMARVKKSPAIIFLIPAVIVSIPGRTLYYTVSSIVMNHWAAARSYGQQTAWFAMAIAMGISMMWALSLTIQRFFTYNKRRKLR